MDQDAPDQQELATRYLSGELTLREAREFEKFCRRHPDILAALPIPVRLKARLAPCDQGYPETPAAATPERHTTAPDEALLTDDGPDSRFGYPGRRALAIGGLVAALAVTIAIATSLAGRTNQLTEQISALERAAQARSLRAPSSLQAFSVAPDPAGPPAVPQIAMRWPDPPQLIELSIDVSQGRYTAFAVTIDKFDEARILQIRRIGADSNRELRIALNSSAFGPGRYDLQIQGYTWRGELESYGWVRLDLFE